MRRFLKGFVFAARGIAAAVRHERNFRFHLCAGALVLWFAARYYSFSGLHWAVLSLTVAGVLSLEAVNSAIELAVAAACPQQNTLAGQAKDLAAGAVLLLCLGAAGVGIALFWQPAVLLRILQGWWTHWYRPVLLTGYLTVSGLFVFHTPKKQR